MYNKKDACTCTQLLRSSLREPQGGEKASAKHQIIVRQSLAYTQKPPSDKWHNERTIPNVRAP